MNTPVNSDMSHAGETPAPSANDGSAFPVTQWSVVLRAGANTDTQAHAALEALCRRYWYPLYTFARRQGRTHHEAEDCTQDFLSQLLASDGLQRARPERGRFRTFLLTGLRNFITSEWRRTQAAKRGGGMVIDSFAAPDSDRHFRDEPHDPTLTPEQAFDRSWALGMIDRAVHELRVEYQKSGRERVFNTLAPFVWGDAAPESLAAQAESLDMTVQALTVALHRARRRLGDRLRHSVAETVADPAEIDTELNHLISAIRRTSSRE